MQNLCLAPYYQLITILRILIKRTSWEIIVCLATKFSIKMVIKDDFLYNKLNIFFQIIFWRALNNYMVDFSKFVSYVVYMYICFCNKKKL